VAAVAAEPALEPVETAQAASAPAAGPEPARPVDLGSFEPLPAPSEAAPSGPFLMLGLVGLGLIIAALVWLFRPADPGSVEGVSWGVLLLGLAGIGCVVAALWFTLGREDLETDEHA